MEAPIKVTGMPEVPQTGPDGLNLALGLMVFMQAMVNSSVPEAGMVYLLEVETVPLLPSPLALDASSVHVPPLS